MPVDVIMENGKKFKGNIQIQGELIDKIEQDLALNYLMNHNKNYVLSNYQNFIKTVQNMYGMNPNVQPRNTSRI